MCDPTLGTIEFKAVKIKIIGTGRRREETVKKESFLMVSRTFGVNHCLVAKMFSKLRIKINNFLKCRFVDFYLDACPLL